MRVRILAAVAALALGTAVSSGAANAATYILDASNAFSAPPYGQVTVTGSSTDLHFDVLMYGTNQIVDTGGHFAFTGNLAGSNLALALPVSETGDFSLTTGSGLTNDPFSGFDFGLNCLSCGSGGSSPFGNHLTFDITGTGLSVLTADAFNGETIRFAVDMINGAGVTGVVGGGPLGGVPEPATWGLMLTGVFCIGAVMRQRRRQALTIA